MYYINYINYTSLFRTYSDILVTLSECSLIYCIVILIGAGRWVLILWVNCMTRVVRRFGAPPLLRWGAKVSSTSIIRNNIKTDSNSTRLADKLWLVHIHILKVGAGRWGNTQSKCSDSNADEVVPQLHLESPGLGVYLIHRTAKWHRVMRPQTLRRQLPVVN